MLNIGVRSKFFGLAGAAGVLLGANAAFAASYNVGTQRPNSDSWGNSNFSASYSYQSGEFSKGSVASDLVTRSSGATQLFNVKAKLFGASVTGVGWFTGASASMRRSGSTPQTYQDQVTGQAILFNDELFHLPIRDQPCPDHGAEWSCTEFNKTLSKTFFKASATFLLGFVPVTVDGELVGSVGATQGAWSRAMPFMARPDSLRSTALAQMALNTYIEGRLHAYTGIRDVLAVGVTLKIRFIDVSLSSKSMSRQDALTTGVTISHTNMMPLNIKSMSGKVTVWADLGPYTEEQLLINIPGYESSLLIEGFENVGVRI